MDNELQWKERVELSFVCKNLGVLLGHICILSAGTSISLAKMMPNI